MMAYLPIRGARGATLLCLASLWGCDSGAGVVGGEGSCVDLPAPPPGCMADCADGRDSECQSGTFCSPDSVCEAECTNDSDCGSSRACNAAGHCANLNCLELPGPPFGCGATCSRGDGTFDGDPNRDCPFGTWCSPSDLCEAFCTTQAGCAEGEVCSDRGGCIPAPACRDLAFPPVGCGTTCTAGPFIVTECPTGTHCSTSEGICEAFCSIDTECGEGRLCDSLGLCDRETCSDGVMLDPEAAFSSSVLECVLEGVDLRATVVLTMEPMPDLFLGRREFRVQMRVTFDVEAVEALGLSRALLLVVDGLVVATEGTDGISAAFLTVSPTPCDVFFSAGQSVDLTTQPGYAGWEIESGDTLEFGLRDIELRVDSTTERGLLTLSNIGSHPNCAWAGGQAPGFQFTEM